MSGGTSRFQFAADGIVIDNAVVAELAAAHHRRRRGAAQLVRLLRGEAVPEYDPCDGEPVAVELQALAPRFGRVVRLWCGELSVLIEPLDDGQLDRVVRAGHRTRGGPVRSVDEFVAGEGPVALVRLRNVFVTWPVEE